MGWIQIFYLQKLGEFCVAEVLASLMAKVQPDEVTVPVEGNMMMHAGLAEDVTYILWKCEMLLITRVADIISRCCLQNPPPPYPPIRLHNVYVPKEMFPVPVLSNSWKAIMNRASGAQRTDSKAKNSWNEINLLRQSSSISLTLHNQTASNT